MSWFLLDRNLKLLEPYDWKLSRTVLRGERGSNAPDLPGKESIIGNQGRIKIQNLKLYGQTINIKITIQ